MSTFGRESADVLPEPDMIRLGPLVAWQRDAFDGTYPICVWHFCDHSGWRAKSVREGWTPNEDAMTPAWGPVNVTQHDVISTDPLHLEPSVYWPDCCGLHGFIRNGVWTDA